MAQIAAVRLPLNPKVLWFKPGELDIHKGDALVVETARGIEFGHAAEDLIEVDEKRIKALKGGLKPVLRLATSADEEKAERMRKASDEALPVFKEMAAEANENMHPVSVEYLLEGDKAVFYFEAEERIDFRDLVRKLASHFRVRIDMRQIGVRDEARMIGGYGHCGEELCCKRLGGDFNPVSIRMAKEQDLSLNPQKISGVCGRLMCCLRYEFDVYKDFKSRAPKMNASIKVPEGKAKVTNLDVPREIVSIRTEDSKTLKIPLAEMETSKKGERPDRVSAEVFEKYSSVGLLSDRTGGLFNTAVLSGEAKLSDGTVRTVGGKSRRKDGVTEVGEKQATKKPNTRKRRSHSAAGGQDSTGQGQAAPGQGSGKRTRRRRGRGQNARSASSTQAPSNAQSANSRQSSQGEASGPRPGQRSSGLRTQTGQTSRGDRPARASKDGLPETASSGSGRRSRRRSHKMTDKGVQEKSVQEKTRESGQE